MSKFYDFIDWGAKRMGMTREEYIATYLVAEKKSPKLTYLWLTYNDRGGRLYSATFRYDNGDELKLSFGDEDEIQSRIKDAYGLDVEVAYIQDIWDSEKELLKLSKKLKIDFTIYEHDLS